MEVFVVTRPEYFEGEAQRINELFRNGLQVLHIRKPGNDIVAFRQLMEEIDPVFYDRIAIHQHHELAEELGLIRLHYPEKLRELIVASRKELTDPLRKESGKTSMKQEVASGEIEGIKTGGIIMSTSIHDLHALKDCLAYDYVFYGPVFNSISKPGYEGVLAADFSLPERRGGPKLIAIGGVTLSKLQILDDMNFDGAALLGAVW